MNDRPTPLPPQLEGSPAPVPAEDELYAALRAAGASPEEAAHCCEIEAYAAE